MIYNLTVIDYFIFLCSFMISHIRTRLHRHICLQKDRLHRHASIAHSRLSDRLIHIHGRLKHHHKKVKESIQHMVTHRFFYPIFLSTFVIGVAISLGASASTPHVNNVLDEMCTHNQQQNTYANCGSFERIRTAVDRSAERMFTSFQKKYDAGMRNKALDTAQDRIYTVKKSLMSRGKYTTQHDFVFYYMTHKFDKQRAVRKKQSSDAMVVVREFSIATSYGS